MLIERTVVKTTAYVEGYSSLITPQHRDRCTFNTDIFVNNLIGFHLNVITRDLILGIFSVQTNYHAFQLVQMYIFLTGLLQKFTTDRLKSYFTVLGLEESDRKITEEAN